MLEVWVLYMMVIMPNNTPIQMRNVETFETQQFCLDEGQVKAPDIAQSLADQIGHPIRFVWRCIKEGEGV